MRRVDDDNTGISVLGGLTAIYPRTSPAWLAKPRVPGSVRSVPHRSGIRLEPLARGDANNSSIRASSPTEGVTRSNQADCPSISTLTSGPLRLLSISNPAWVRRSSRRSSPRRCALTVHHKRTACCRSSSALISSNLPVRALPASVLSNASAIGSIP